MITFTIDTLTPCLTETSTGEIFETEVIQLKRKSFLSGMDMREIFLEKQAMQMCFSIISINFKRSHLA